MFKVVTFISITNQVYGTQNVILISNIKPVNVDKNNSKSVISLKNILVDTLKSNKYVVTLKNINKYNFQTNNTEIYYILTSISNNRDIVIVDHNNI